MKPITRPEYRICEAAVGVLSIEWLASATNGLRRTVTYREIVEDRNGLTVQSGWREAHRAYHQLRSRFQLGSWIIGLEYLYLLNNALPIDDRFDDTGTSTIPTRGL